MINIKNLSLTYNLDKTTVYALNNINFDIKYSENKTKVVGLVGESGSGKSTLAHAILRLLPSSISNIKSGEIFYKNKDILKLNYQDLKNIRGQEISMIFQNPMSSLNPVTKIDKLIIYFKQQDARLSNIEKALSKF